MDTRKLIGMALVAVLALGLAACGARDEANTSTPTGQNTNNASGPVDVAFECVPSAKVWIDGTERGTTPVSIALTPGAHKVVFQRDGFDSDEHAITVSGPTKVEGGLVLARDGAVEALADLGQSLGVEIEVLGDVPRHRGASTAAATLYWPRLDVRPEGLTSYRIEVGSDYADDGVLRFESKGKVLYEEAFSPVNEMTTAEIPQQVIDAIKGKTKVTWGLFFEDKKKKDVKAEFTVVNEPKVSKQLEKMATSKHFSRQDPIVQQMMRAEVFLNHRLYTEALMSYLGVLQVWPDSTTPYNGIVKSMMRMDLKDTSMYTTALGFVRGKGQGMGREGTGLGIDSIPGALKAPELIAKIREGETSSGNKALGSGHGVKPYDRPDDTPTPEGTEEAGEEMGGTLRDQLLERYHAVNQHARIAREQADKAERNMRQAQEALAIADTHAAETKAVAESTATKVEDLKAQLKALDPASPTYDADRTALEQQLEQAEVDAAQAAVAADHAQQTADAARQAWEAKVQEYNDKDAAANVLEKHAQELLDQAGGLPPDAILDPSETQKPYNDKQIAGLFQGIENAQQTVNNVQNDITQAKALVQQLQADVAADPTNEQLAAQLEAARAALQSSEAALADAQAKLAEAQLAHDNAQAANQQWEAVNGPSPHAPGELPVPPR
jgi:hypothetical protein